MKIYLFLLVIVVPVLVKAQQKSGTYTDERDGQTYQTIQIGNQVWMAENLNYKAGSNCWVYDDNDENAGIYGRLYTWETACEACPDGWHLPGDAEWKTLTEYLGGSDVAGGKLKETGTTHWNRPNTGATNSSGFLALPGGYRYNYGDYVNIGDHATFWSSTELDSVNAWSRVLRFDYNDIARGAGHKDYGFSIRCVKD